MKDDVGHGNLPMAEQVSRLLRENAWLKKCVRHYRQVLEDCEIVCGEPDFD